MKEFLIAYENGRDNCTLYVGQNGRHRGDYHFTKAELEQLKITIDKVLQEWKP